MGSPFLTIIYGIYSPTFFRKFWDEKIKGLRWRRQAFKTRRKRGAEMRRRFLIFRVIFGLGPLDAEIVFCSAGMQAGFHRN